MTLFNFLDFETISSCNRVCPTCIRNSHPDREALQPWFEHHLLPEEIICQALEEAIALGFGGGVCLSHYNEPLMDDRIPAIAAKVKSYGAFSRVFLNTNGDFLTEGMAAALDGALDRIIITLYMDEPVKSQRAEWMAGLFSKTEVHLITQSGHMATHFSPKFDVVGMAAGYRGNPCREPEIRVIINHRQQYLLCCEDVIGNFDLGRFPDIGLKDYWYGKRQEIAAKLYEPGGREWHSYCVTCPRP